MAGTGDTKRAPRLASGLTARQERIAGVLRAEVELRWTTGPIPVLEAGSLFRELAGRLDVQEGAIADVARLLDLWTFTPAQLEAHLKRLRDYGEAGSRYRVTAEDRRPGQGSVMGCFRALD